MISFFLSPNGRFRRRDLWFGLLVVLILLATGLCADVVLMDVGLQPVETAFRYTLKPQPYCLMTAALLCLWPLIAMMLKRWHDMDRSWLWMALLIVPLINIYALILLLFGGGSPSMNQFGPNPRIDPSGRDVDRLTGGSPSAY